MNAWMKKAGLGVALAATALTAAAPADAQRYRGYRHYNRGGDAAAGALLGGIVGLGIGAAIASNNRGRYYDRGYGGYYDAPPPPRVVYRDRYYAPPPRVVVRERYYDYAPRYDYGYRGGYGYGYGY